MKYLVVADAHANLEAFEAITAEADYDRMLFLGDAVDYGPDPEAVVDILIAASREQGVLVQGNHDEGVATPAADFDPSWWSPVAADTMQYSRSRLRPEQLAFLGGLPRTAELDLGVGGRALLAHGIPASNREYLWPDIDEAKVRLLLGTDTAGYNFLFAGHTHLPFERRIDGLRIVNPGSAGQPRDHNPRAAYALYDTAEGRLSFHRVRYPVGVTAGKIRDRAMPHADRLCAILQRGGS